MTVTKLRPSQRSLPLESVRETFTISCHDCVLRRTAACDDCVVTFICGREPADAVVIDVAEIRALRMLADGGLVPELRHRRLSRRGGVDLGADCLDEPIPFLRTTPHESSAFVGSGSSRTGVSR